MNHVSNKLTCVLNCAGKLAATVPELLCGESAVQEPAQILTFLRKQVRVDPEAVHCPSFGNDVSKPPESVDLL